MRVMTCVALALCLSACDDGVLRAFEPHLALGGAGSGGSNSDPGGGGGGAGAGPVIPTSPLLIDDFEDGDPRAKEPLGWWYRINDGTGLQGWGFEAVSRGTASLYALRTDSTQDFQEWGAAIGVNLMIDEAIPLNLEGYEQLCFVARVDPNTSTSVQVHLLRENLHYVRDVSLSETWNRYCFPLTDFVASDGAVLPANEIQGLQFFFPIKAPFAFYLDDVEVTL
jgi:hypothetical protein